jgi:hypothetical protein
MVHKIRLCLLILVSPIWGFSQIDLPGDLAVNQNIILWLSPDTAVYRQNNNEATVGKPVVVWKDISGNGHDFTSVNTKRPRLELVDNKKFVSFFDGKFLSNTSIAAALNGLDAFSIFIEVKSNNTNTDNGIMYSSSSPNGADENFCIRYDSQGANTGRTNLIKAGFQGNTWNNQIETTSNTQTTNTQVLTLTWTKGGKLYSYIDGIPNDSSVNMITTSLSGIESILLGKGAKDVNSDQGWDGYIGTVIFYNEQFNDDVIDTISVGITSITSISSGDWSDVTTWSCDCIPNDNRSVFITTGHAVTMDISPTIGGLDITDGGSLDMGSNSLTLTRRDLKVEGNLISANADLSFTSETAAQMIDIPNGGFNKITLNNSLGLAITGGSVAVHDLLTLTEGVLTTNDKLIFSATPSTSGHLGQVGATSSLLGKVTYQFYKDNAVRGWRYWTIPLEGATLLDMQGEIAVTGTFDNPTEGEGIIATSSSIYEFEAASQSYDNYPKTGNSSQAIFTLGKGYSIYVRDEPARTSICEMSGTAHVGDLTLPLVYTSNSNFVYNGWNLIGNPYISPLSWSSIPLARKVNVSNAIYMTDNTSGGLTIQRSYVNGIGVPTGTTDIIAPSQAFWVQATAPGASLEFKEEDKIQADFNLYRLSSLDGLVRFVVKSSKDEEDEFVVRYNQNSSTDFDLSFDALQLHQNSLKAYSTCTDSIPMDVNNLPSSEQDSVSIILENLTEGEYSIEVSEYAINDENYQYQFVDLALDVAISLNELSNYSFEVTTEKELKDRFFLVTKKTEEVVSSISTLALTQSVVVYPNPTIDKIVNIKYHNITSGAFNLKLINAFGATVFQNGFSQVSTSGNIVLNLKEFVNGIYHLVIIAEDGHQSVNKIIVH